MGNQTGPITDITGPLLQKIETMQEDLNALNSEVEQLHRRDQALDDYMQRIDEEMRLAAKLQREFMPRKFPEVGTVRFHSLFRPASYVSGDFYDVMRLDENHVGFYMMDAIGHGMPAALLTIFLKQSLVTKEITPPNYRLLEPGESLQRLNQVMLDYGLSSATFVTAVYGMINVKTLELKLARGGHPGPILLRGDGAVDVLEPDGALLGVFPEETFATASVQLCKGDRLVIYTDGIEVAFSDDRGQSQELWQAELQRRSHLTAGQLLADLESHLDSEAGSLAPKDDLTMMIAEV